MAEYTVLINAVDKAASNVLLQGFQINEVTNGINTLVCEVESEDASYRPAKRQTIEVYENDGTSPVRLIFGGTIRMVRERGFGQPADGIDDIVQSVSADSYRALAERKYTDVDEAYPSQSLKATFTDVVNTYLATYGVTVDPSMATGPTLEAMEFKAARIDEVFNFLAQLTAKYGDPFTWAIGYDKVAGMYQTGTVAAPWNLIEGDGTEEGDVEVEPTDEEYANKIIIIWGSNNVIDLGPDGLNTPQQFTGDGITNSFALTYQLVGPVPPPPLTSPPTASAIGYAYVNVPGGLIEFLGNTGTFGAEWEYDQTTNSISRVAGAPPLGYVFSVPYRGIAQGTVTAEDAAEIAANGLWEYKLLLPEIEDPVLAQTIADAELARRLATGRIVRFRTRRMPALEPGQFLTITVPKRAISGTFTVTSVSTEYNANDVNDPSDLTESALVRSYTCESSIKEQSHQTLTRWWSDKDTTGIATPAGSSAVPDWPLNSVQFNDQWAFGGAAHVLYGDLFWSQPDLFTSPPEEQSKGLIFVQNQDIGDDGHIGLTDPQRTEMGMIGEGDFSIDTFGIAASMLLNATGDIVISAGAGSNSPGSPAQEFGSVSLVGNQSITYDLAHLGGIDPGVNTRPGDIGDSFSRFHQLNVIDGLAGFYQTVSALPYTVNTTTASDTNEFLAFVSTAGTGTIFLPFHASAGSPDYRIFPATATGRMFWFQNNVAGTLTLDAGTAGSNINGASTITLGQYAAVLLLRHDNGYLILGTQGGVSGGGSGGTAAGPLNAVQYNNPVGTFDGTADFTYDETIGQIKQTRTTLSSQFLLLTPGEERRLISMITNIYNAYSEIAFGKHFLSDIDTAEAAAPAFLYARTEDTGSPSALAEIGMEVVPGETPGSAMTYNKERGVKVDENAKFTVYQVGGLGSGSPSAGGCSVYIQRNDDGEGAAATVALENRHGEARYLWNDEETRPRWHDTAPSEDGSPSTSDTDGHLIFHGHHIVAASDDQDTDNTVHNDPELFFDVEANTVYNFELFLLFTTGTSTTPDAKYRFTMPTGATLSQSGIGFTLAATATTQTYMIGEYEASTPTAEIQVGVLSTATIQASPVRASGVITVGATAGTIQLQWAQNTTTGGTPTLRKAKSYLKAIRVSRFTT